MKKILVINPGSTSTKIAVFEDRSKLFEKSIEHLNEVLEKYNKIADQYEMRLATILDVLKEMDFDVNNLDLIVARGGLLPPVKSGAYLVNKDMLDRLINNPVVEHASNLGAIIANEIANKVGISAYIYDSVSVDELEDVARISGIKEIPRKSLSHALNMRAVAINTAKKYKKEYSKLNIIVAHLGGGITHSVHKNGKMIDIISDDEGAFSPERSGEVPCRPLMDLCYLNEKKYVKNLIKGKGGLVSYLGTNSALEALKMIENGDKDAKLVLEALSYQVAKGIGELATVVDGKVDYIILTGGLAYSEFITNHITKKVEFISKVEIVAGENELEALAFGGLRVLNGEEEYLVYQEL